jgi:gliding motility-associated lipoprotein GldH
MKVLSSSFLFFIGLCLSLSSCDRNVVMETHQNLQNEQWDYSNPVNFTAEIQDTVQHYNIYVTLRHGFNFEWRNLWVNIETTFPDGKQYERRVNLPLSEADGEWFGDCLGDNCDIRIPIQMNAYFPKLGKYSFRVSQNMRQNPLSYMKSVGMRIEKAK